MYERFGFVGAVAEGHLVIPVRNVEQAAGGALDAPVPGVRSGSPADLPAMIRLYNTAHAHRPWPMRPSAGSRTVNSLSRRSQQSRATATSSRRAAAAFSATSSSTVTEREGSPKEWPSSTA
ncbi:hypothetical protein [Streptomyces sp. NPDC003393]